MPAIETLDRQQYAVLWVLFRIDQYGEEEFIDPSTLKVRWIQKQSKVTDPKGNTTTLDGQVVANIDIPLRSVMWLTTVPRSTNPIADFSTLQRTGVIPTGLMRVETLIDKTPDIKARNYRRNYGLKRYKDTVMPLGSNPIGSEFQMIGDELSMIGAT